MLYTSLFLVVFRHALMDIESLTWFKFKKKLILTDFKHWLLYSDSFGWVRLYIIVATSCQIKADKGSKWAGAAPVWINLPWIRCVEGCRMGWHWEVLGFTGTEAAIQPITVDTVCVNALAPGWYSSNFKNVIFKHISHMNATEPIDHKPILGQVLAWCCQATSHYLSQYWPSCMSPYGLTKPQWVKTCIPAHNIKYPQCCVANVNTTNFIFVIIDWGYSVHTSPGQENKIVKVIVWTILDCFVHFLWVIFSCLYISANGKHMYILKTFFHNKGDKANHGIALLLLEDILRYVVMHIVITQLPYVYKFFWIT